MAPMLAASVPSETSSAAPLLEAGAAVDTPNLVGRWTGSGQQSDGQSWEISLDVANSSGSLHARVTYPRLSCGGEWNLESTGAREWGGDEHIAYGTDRCVENGIVHVRLTEAGALEFDWREIGGRGSTARGSLRRAVVRR